jgi:hypothetical protein
MWYVDQLVPPKTTGKSSIHNSAGADIESTVQAKGQPVPIIGTETDILTRAVSFIPTKPRWI